MRRQKLVQEKLWHTKYFSFLIFRKVVHAIRGNHYVHRVVHKDLE